MDEGEENLTDGTMDWGRKGGMKRNALL